MSWESAVGSDVMEPGIAKPAVESRTETSVGGAEGDWLCAWCLGRVANERDRFDYNGKDEFHFSNPQGIHFDIITFLQTLGCRQSGLPTLNDTWFPGHAWSYCLCAGCGQHLGWYYAGQHCFAGLIKERIVRALPLRN